MLFGTCIQQMQYLEKCVQTTMHASLMDNGTTFSILELGTLRGSSTFLTGVWLDLGLLQGLTVTDSFFIFFS